MSRGEPGSIPRRRRASCATTPASRSARRPASGSWTRHASLRYRPNALARGLRTRRTDTLGLIIPSLDNLGFADVTHGIQSAAAAAGKLVMVVEAEAAAGASTQRVYERLIGDGRLDGTDRRVRIPRRRPRGAARRAGDPAGAGQPAHLAGPRIGGRRRRARQPDGGRAPRRAWATGASATSAWMPTPTPPADG